LNALFADIVEATHRSGSKGLFKGFRKKWNSFIATLNILFATILTLLFPLLPITLSLAVPHFDALKMMKPSLVNNWNIVKKANYVSSKEADRDVHIYIYISPLHRQTDGGKQENIKREFTACVYYVYRYNKPVNVCTDVCALFLRNWRKCVS